MTVTEKVAYLKGLMEGLSVDETTKEGKILKAVVDVLDDLAMSVEDLEDYTAELTEQVDAVDEDLDSLENDFYGECDCCDDDEDEEYYDITCPSCGDEFSVDEDTLLEGGIECPNCGEHLEFDVECDDCGCDCCSDEEDEEK